MIITMNILPLNDTNALQINPNLGIILANGMEGWFLERYINIFMNGNVVDYIDNVNYSGIIHCERIYTNQEVQLLGIINIIEQELAQNHFLHIWIDEIALRQSARYQIDHFVHPLMVYGFDEKQQVVKAVFFDILKGQVLIDITYQDMIKATSNLDLFYHCAGTDNAIRQTVQSCYLDQNIKGDFHLDVFSKELNHYICCQTESATEWYTLCRPGVFDSNDNIFGIQIYLHLIKMLACPESIVELSYKTLHDFVSHKKYLLNRLRFLQANYDTSCDFDRLVKTFAENCNTLEYIRLLNIKKQIRLKEHPADLCRDPNFTMLLSRTLQKCYNVEMEVLPQICKLVSNLTYSKDYCQQNRSYVVPKVSGTTANKYIGYDMSDYNPYITKIDIIREGECYTGDYFEYILLNDSIKYYLEKDSSDHIPVRSLKISPVKLHNVKIFTDTEKCNYTINVYPLDQKKNIDIVKLPLDESWRGRHHLDCCWISDTNALLLSIQGEDPFIIKEEIGVDADIYPYIHIKMRTDVKTTYAQIFFATIELPNLSMNRSMFINIIPDGASHSYYVNMARHKQWRGIIKTIRFDPAQYHDIFLWDDDKGTMCMLECFEFVRNKPDNAEDCLTVIELEDDRSTFGK